MITAEQMMSAHKTNVENFFGLTGIAFEGIEKMIELNVQTAKTAMAEAAEATQAALSMKDPQQLLAARAGMMQPAAEKAAAYCRHLYDIASSTGAEVSKVAEATTADVQAKFLAVVDNAVKNAPAGTENAVALVKSAVAAATNAYESASSAVKQASEVADANIQALSATTVRSSKSKRG